MQHWQDMPSFDHEDQSPYKSLTINFVNKESMDKFFQLIKQDYNHRVACDKIYLIVFCIPKKV